MNIQIVEKFEPQTDNEIVYIYVTLDNLDQKYVAIGKPYTKETLISALKNLAMSLE